MEFTVTILLLSMTFPTPILKESALLLLLLSVVAGGDGASKMGNENVMLMVKIYFKILYGFRSSLPFLVAQAASSFFMQFFHLMCQRFR